MNKAPIIPVLLSGVSVNPLFTGVTCPAIVPTVGPTELLTNPGFEGTYDTEASGIDVAPGWSNSGLDTGTDTASKETSIFHGGSASQKFVNDAANEGIAHDANVLATGKWYQISLWAYRNSGGSSARMRDTILATLIDTGLFATTGAWSQAIGTGRSTGAGSLGVQGSAGWNGQVDDASCMEIDFASMLTSLGSLTGRDGTYICKPTAAACTQVGMAIGYLDVNNLVLAYIDRVSLTAKLIKRISGTWTSVISASFTYSAGAELKVIISGTSYSLYYNGTQIGTTQTISDTLGYEVHGFNSLSGNSVGVVSANP